MFLPSLSWQLIISFSRAISLSITDGSDKLKETKLIKKQTGRDRCCVATLTAHPIKSWPWNCDETELTSLPKAGVNAFCLQLNILVSSLINSSVYLIFNLWKCAEGEDPSCSVFFSSFCLFLCGSVPDPPASWSSLARFTGDEGRREINSLVFSTLRLQCLWGSLECKAIQIKMAQHQSRQQYRA